MQDKKSYYSITPAYVRYDKELPAHAKLLYGEITALCNEKGFCWATNDYFAKAYNFSARSVGNWLKALEDKGYIKRELRYKEGSKQVEERRIYLNTPIENNFVPYRKNLHDPIEDKFRDNNTINIKNNNSHKYSSEHLRLANLLKNNLSETFTKEMSRVDINKWSNDMRLLNEKDNYSIEAIEYVLNWLPTNDFWFGNIRSVAKLRKQFEQLTYQIKQERNKKKPQEQSVYKPPKQVVPAEYRE